MKTFLMLSALFASSAQAAPLTIWSCFNSGINATITTEIRMRAPEQGGPSVDYLTVTNKTNQVLSRMVVEPQALIQMEGRGIQASYVGHNAQMSVQVTVTSKPTAKGGYATKIVYQMDGTKFTNNVSCLRARGLRF